MRRSVYKEVTVEVDLGEFDDDELIDLLEERGFTVLSGRIAEPWQALADAFHFRRDPDRVLSDLIYQYTGRIVRIML